jgi:hypothetical protein
VVLLLILVVIGLFGFALLRESTRADFLSRPSGTFIDGFTKPYRTRNHPLFGDKAPMALRIVGACLAAVGTIGLLAIVLRKF